MSSSETKCHFMNKNQSQLNFHRAVQGLSDIKASGFTLMKRQFFIPAFICPWGLYLSWSEI